MKLPLQISYTHVARSEAINNIIKEKAQKLDRLCPEIISCRVTITMPHKSHKRRNFFSVRIDISLPGKEVVVGKEAHNDFHNSNFYHVLKEAFDAAYRQVEDYSRIRQNNSAA